MESDTNSGPRDEKKIRWALIIVVFFLVGLAIDHFFLHIIFEERMKEKKIETHSDSTKPSTLRSKSTSTAVAAATPIHTEPIPGSLEAVRHFQDKIKACLGAELSKNASPENLIQNYLEKNPVQTSQFQLENTHVRLPDGSTRRLHVAVADRTTIRSGSEQSRELRYFQLDAEGLPVRIPLSKELSLNPRPEFLQSLKNQGHVVFHQVKENKLLKDGTHLSLNLVNEKVFEFQVFAKHKTLSCRELDCLCR